MPDAYFGIPEKVYKDTDGMVMVEYPGQRRPKRLFYLGRQDLMRVAGAIAKSRGKKSPGVRGSNDDLIKWIKKEVPWEGAGEPKGGKAPAPRQPRKKAPVPDKAPDTPAPDEQGRIATKVTCECGHEYTYRIKEARYEATKKWLESKPCPPCQKGVPGQPTPGKPKDQQQDGQGEPLQDPDGMDADEMDAEEEGFPKLGDGNIDLDKLADVLVQKVQERLQPIKMPPLHHEVLPEVVKLLNADLAVWMQGPPGTSKSTIGAQAAEALDLPFYAISCHEGMTRSDMFGYTDANGTDHRSPLWDAFEKGGVLLLDEIDNGNANILAALNSALSNGHCTFAGKTIRKHDNFKVLAAANTAGLGPESGFIGRMGVDLATLDRFVQLRVDIDNKLEEAIIKSILPSDFKLVLKAVRKLRQVVEGRGLRIVVSPRTSIHSARMLRAGVPLGTALRRTALKGLDETTMASLISEVVGEEA